MDVIMLGRIALIYCLILAAPAIARAQTAPADDKPGPAATDSSESPTMEQPMMGDHWTYEVNDEISGTVRNTNTETITDVTATEISVRTETVGSPGTGYYVYDNLWNLKNTPLWKYSPNDGTGVKLPLKVGSSWTTQDTIQYQGRSVVQRGSIVSKVVGEETITTDAGTFHTFKIQTTTNARSIQDPSKKARNTTTSWYAPSINHWVKKISKSEQNGHVTQNLSVVLVDYGRR
jgi:hypothetical protein